MDRQRIEADPEARHTLAVLAGGAGVGPGYLQRCFRAAVGVSPRRYAEACRLGLLRRSLRTGMSVTSAIFEAGYGSTSRVYERATGDLGMTPGQYRAGGAGLAIAYATIRTMLGPLLLAVTDRGLCRVHFLDDGGDPARLLRAEFPGAELEPAPVASSGALDAWATALRAAVDGEPPAGALPVVVRATAFRLRVWDFLQRIPVGETRSYGDVAMALGRPGAARAVAGACAANPVALAIPCHRVIRGDGDLAGYRWGVDRKRALLSREAVRRAPSVIRRPWPGGAGMMRAPSGRARSIPCREEAAPARAAARVSADARPVPVLRCHAGGCGARGGRPSGAGGVHPDAVQRMRQVGPRCDIR